MTSRPIIILEPAKNQATFHDAVTIIAMFVAINSVVLFIICIFFALLLIDTQVEILLAFEIIPHFATQCSSYTQPCMQNYQLFDRLSC